MLDLSALTGALAQIEHIGKGTTVCRVNGVDVTLRTLNPDEEKEAFRFSRLVLDETEEGQRDAGVWQEYLDRVKIATLSYSIVQIGNLSLRDPYVLVGHDESGKPQSRRKHEVTRDILSGTIGGKPWSSDFLRVLFKAYAEMKNQAEVEAEKAVQFTPVDYATEIKRLEDRVAELRSQQKNQGEKNAEPLAKAFQAFTELEEEESRVVLPDVEPGPTTLPEPVAEPIAKAPVAPPPPRRATPPVAPPVQQDTGSMLSGDVSEEEQIARENQRLKEELRRSIAQEGVPVSQEAVELGPQKLNTGGVETITRRPQVGRPPVTDQPVKGTQNPNFRRR